MVSVVEGCRLYLVQVTTPGGGVVEVGGAWVDEYAAHAAAVALALELADPVPHPLGERVEVWETRESLRYFDADPAACVVEVVRLADEAGPDAPHGRRVVASEPLSQYAAFHAATRGGGRV